MAEKWQLIIEAYKKAKAYLWESEPGLTYRRDKEKGMIYLYNAYHDALKEENKEHLWYARILFMMYEMHRGRYSEQMLFHCFLEKAYHEYKTAISENEEPERSEMEQTESAYKKSKQYTDMKNSCKDKHKELKGLIGGKAVQDDFSFSGGRIVLFWHDTNNAMMKITDNYTVVTLRFTDIYEVTSCLLPAAAWVTDITCRRDPDLGTILFDIGGYKILCSGVEAVEIAEAEETADV